MEFEWNETKRQQNIERHGIDFVAVTGLYGHPHAVTTEDRRRNYGETRFVLMCEESGVLFHVTYTLREENTRIISARQPKGKETL